MIREAGNGRKWLAAREYIVPAICGKVNLLTRNMDRVPFNRSAYQNGIPLQDGQTTHWSQNGNRFQAGQTAGGNRHHFVPSRFALQVPELQTGSLPGAKHLRMFTSFPKISGNFHKQHLAYPKKNNIDRLLDKIHN
ncbi:MAG: hypothetical protein F4X65_15195 [Chloroflexi bacterium]|nr:hypothetical protein [Chloroflexota bacterium]